MKATSELDANVKDSEGGKQDSFRKCFGYPLAQAPLPTVKKNAQGTVTSEQPENCLIKLSYSPRQNWLFRRNMLIVDNYSISFIIRPLGRIGPWGNLFHFTIGRDMTNFGDRSPAIWLTPNGTSLHVRIGDSRDVNWGFDTTEAPINQDSSFRLVCMGNQVTCTLNDRSWSFTQPSRRYRGNGDLYLGDPWYSAARCEIKNFCYSAL
jgi:hypothetical protein